MRPLLGVKYNFNLNLNLSVRPGCLVSDLDVLAGGGLLGASAVGVVVLLTTTRGPPFGLIERHRELIVHSTFTDKANINLKIKWMCVVRDEWEKHSNRSVLVGVRLLH
jgi:hypothetical protein